MDTLSKKRKNLLLLIAYLSTFLFGSQEIFAQFTDNSPGIGESTTIPANVTSVTVSIWGAGGGGGGSSTNGQRGAGGGGGAASRTFGVTSGDLLTYTVGTAGTAGPAAAGNGGAGTATTITYVPLAATMTAGGGGGGTRNNGAVGTAGAIGTGGTTNVPGNAGSTGATTGNGGNSGTVVTIFGTGGNGSTNAVGNPGGTPGAGGGGGEDAGGGGGDRAGGAGSNGQVFINYITVSNITPNPVCVGSTITITGTNFAAGANTVSINGTACTGVVRVNATTITAVVATGTTSGVVLVTNPNGTNNGRSITVNPLPAAIGGGAATVCTGASTPAFTNATAGGTWSIINGTGSATIVRLQTKLDFC